MAEGLRPLTRAAVYRVVLDNSLPSTEIVRRLKKRYAVKDYAVRRFLWLLEAQHFIEYLPRKGWVRAT